MTLDQLRNEHAKACILEQCADNPADAKAASNKADRLGKLIEQQEAFVRMEGYLAAAKLAEDYEESKAFYLRFQDARLEWLRLSYGIIDSRLAPRGA
jgi:hypothetical protein